MRKLKTAFVGAMFAAVTLAPASGSAMPRQRSGRDVKVLGHRNPKGGLGLQMVSVLVASCLCLPGALPLLPPLPGDGVGPMGVGGAGGGNPPTESGLVLSVSLALPRRFLQPHQRGTSHTNQSRFA